MAPVKVFGTAVFANAARVMACVEPFGQIPAFQDGDIMLFESRAIAKYSKPAQEDLLREGNPEEAAMVDVWTEVEAHQYNPALSPIVYECLINPVMRGVPTNQKVVDESLEKFKKVLDVYEAHLSGEQVPRRGLLQLR
ncbi:putative glutathione S-transferase GSTF1 [Dichanthelium oligosanthes]|uniref:glutathione transferase n=1 Tax=Dichanthelium oligosanthes TaxID=888268 RepID=A0A1E5UKC6_9POAL|nr:putative glutathione S-transferase GSTF1 [Dichanthelium oligosanthes]